MIANENVMIAFFIRLHFVNMSDVKNVRKFTKKKKNIGSTK